MFGQVYRARSFADVGFGRGVFPHVRCILIYSHHIGLHIHSLEEGKKLALFTCFLPVHSFIECVCVSMCFRVCDCEWCCADKQASRTNNNALYYLKKQKKINQKQVNNVTFC